MANYTVWECLVCGWVYDEAQGWPEDGIEAGTRWEDVPDDWLCPECGVGKDDFEMVPVAESETETQAETQNETSHSTSQSDTIDDQRQPLVILGSGLAGYNLIKEIRKLDSVSPIVMITADDGRYYSKPLISTGFHKGKSPDAMSSATALEMAREFSVEIRIFTRVSAIDRAARELTLQAGDRQQTLNYDKLVLACGAECIEAPLSGKGLSQVYSVNDLLDYTRFCTAMAKVKRVLIIGAGLIGCEYANDLIQAGYEVDLVDPMNRVLGSLLPTEASTSVQTALEQAGVKFHLNTVVETVDKKYSGRGVIATLGSGETIDADIVLSAIGVRARTALAKSAGLDTGRGIVVDRSLKTSDEHVYALGDCAEVGGHVLHYVAPLMASARALAQTLSATDAATKDCEVCYGTLPVTVKTTLFPVITNPPARGLDGEWIIEEDSSQGVKALFKNRTGELLGFALTGTCVAEKEALTKLTHPIMK